MLESRADDSFRERTAPLRMTLTFVRRCRMKMLWMVLLSFRVALFFFFF